jgi:macrolide-specific efflux system membrane fusion protein
MRGFLGLAILGIPYASAAPTQDTEGTVLVEDAILKTIHTTSVAAQASGVLTAFDLREGIPLNEGQEVGRIRDTSIRLQSEKAKASLDIATQKRLNDIDVRLAAKNKAVSENEYQRAVEANRLVRDTYPLNEIDRLKLITDRATLELERAVFQQKMAELEMSVSEWEHKQSLELLDRHRIVAPCAGMVVSIEKTKGEWVEPGTVLFKMVQIDLLRIEGFLNAKDALLDRIGSTASLQIESPSMNLKRDATVIFVSPDVNPLNGQVRVLLQVDNKDHKLRPGLRPKVTLHSTIPPHVQASDKSTPESP